MHQVVIQHTILEKRIDQVILRHIESRNLINYGVDAIIHGSGQGVYLLCACIETSCF